MSALTMPADAGASAASAVPVLSLTDVAKRYVTGAEIVSALQGVSLDIHVGQYVAIIGQSGSGKSTLMNILGCLDTPTSGTYRLAGHDVSTLDETRLAQVRNAEIGFVFQQFHLLATLSAWRNVELPLVYAGMDRPERKRLAMQALERVGLGHRVEHRPNELSGGQQQRVAVARALVTNPAMILADEPTGNLDSASTDDVLGLFADLHAAGSTIVLITHETEVASRASRRVKLSDGLIVSDESDDDAADLTHTSLNTLLGLPAQRGSWQ
ncbi:MAG TPA: ABC transporter ATP-binding protein [Sporichthyaceae bacterium]|jgi:putative ABC transport system ATP-binding protein|nr:ABC transporter ATP-binding protein [Sporichthyaceae bacterium]